MAVLEFRSRIERHPSATGKFIRVVPHVSFIPDAANGEYLWARYKGLAHHLFTRKMEFTADPRYDSAVGTTADVRTIL
ncbi:MAG: malate:quinone oxidoreductase [Janthinobacterium lividum]